MAHDLLMQRRPSVGSTVSRVSLLARWLAQGLDHLLPLTDTYRTLELRMAQVDDALIELDQATNEVAAELEELAGRVDQFDTNVAGEIRTRAGRLRSLAADPENPVPDPEEPADPNA